jgi:4'-phosphopantetheinyl transferase
MILPRDEVHLWYAVPESVEGEERQAAARALLTATEEEQRHRYRFERDRTLFLATRMLVRTTLSLYADVAPRDWRFTVGEHGRPEIGWPLTAPPLQFNLAQTNGLVVCAVGRGRPLGVDVENLSREAPIGLIDRVFAPSEAAAFHELPADLRTERFFEHWTLKESYVKARGLGLSLPLEQIAFRLFPERPPRVAFGPEITDEPDSWQFVQLRPTRWHTVALCVQAGEEHGITVVPRWEQASAAVTAAAPWRPAPSTKPDAVQKPPSVTTAERRKRFVDNDRRPVVMSPHQSAVSRAPQRDISTVPFAPGNWETSKSM